MRAVTMPKPRLSEAAKLGFTRAIIPQANLKRLEKLGWTFVKRGPNLHYRSVFNEVESH